MRGGPLSHSRTFALSHFLPRMDPRAALRCICSRARAAVHSSPAAGRRFRKMNNERAMMKKALLPAAATALLLGAVACKEPLDVGSFSVDGEWRGRAVQPVGTDSAVYT